MENGDSRLPIGQIELQLHPGLPYSKLSARGQKTGSNLEYSLIKWQGNVRPHSSFSWAAHLPATRVDPVELLSELWLTSSCFGIFNWVGSWVTAWGNVCHGVGGGVGSVFWDDWDWELILLLPRLTSMPYGTQNSPEMWLGLCSVVCKDKCLWSKWSLPTH